MAVCIALTSCAGLLVAFVAALFAFPPLLLVLDMTFRSTRDDPPFRWLEPMFWLLPLSSVIGAFAGALHASRRLRRGRLPNQTQQPTGAPSGAGG